MKGYENLIGIDSAFCISTLTSGFCLRFNPIDLNQQERISNYLGDLKNRNGLFAIMGSELSNPTTKPTHSKTSTASNRRFGHSFSLIDIIHSNKTDESYLKLRNSQVSMKLAAQSQEITGELMAIDKKKLDIDKQNGIFYMKFEDMFKYFEILSVLMCMEPKLERKLLI